MQKVIINEKHEYKVEPDTDGRLKLNGEAHKPDLVKISDTRYHMLLNGKSYRISLTEQTDEKHMAVAVNGNKYMVAMKDRFDLLLHDLGMEGAFASQAEDVKAPMPGLVLNILVEAGQEVAKGDALLVLEAMKMENVLKAPHAGTVTGIKVKMKDAVEKGQVLITFA